MNGKLCFISIVLFFVCSRVICFDIVFDTDGVNVQNGPQEITEVDIDGADLSILEKSDSRMNSTLHKSFKRFYCSVDNFNNTYLLVYGTKSWTFPQQDVNLTLAYPSANNDFQRMDHQAYLITGLEVILFVDGRRSKGYITSGGIMQRSISLSFVTSNITMLSYQFWLHGTPSVSMSGVPVAIETNSIFLC